MLLVRRENTLELRLLLRRMRDGDEGGLMSSLKSTTRIAAAVQKLTYMLYMEKHGQQCRLLSSLTLFKFTI